MNFKHWAFKTAMILFILVGIGVVIVWNRPDLANIVKWPMLAMAVCCLGFMRFWGESPYIHAKKLP